MDVGEMMVVDLQGDAPNVSVLVEIETVS